MRNPALCDIGIHQRKAQVRCTAKIRAEKASLVSIDNSSVLLQGPRQLGPKEIDECLCLQA